MSSAGPIAREVLSLPELISEVANFTDVESSASLAFASQKHKQNVTATVRAWVIDSLSPFMGPDDVDPFLSMLHSVGGAVIGHIAEEINSPGDHQSEDSEHDPDEPDCEHDDAVRVDEEPVHEVQVAVSESEDPVCGSEGSITEPEDLDVEPPEEAQSSDRDIYKDLCVVVPGPDALKRGVSWFQRRGYSFWRGRNLFSQGDMTQMTDFVARSKEKNGIPVGPAVMIVWGQSGIILATVLQPIGQKFTVLTRSRAHSLSPLTSPPAAGRRRYHLFSVPYHSHFKETSPSHLLKMIYDCSLRITSCISCRRLTFLDFEKGERQGNVDYITCESVETTRADRLLGLRFAYDVNCQYCVHFRDRIKGCETLSFPESMTIAFLIGLFHVHGHVEECLARYAPTFLTGAGVTAGEILESLWAKMNPAAGPTRNMTLANRSETLDACMADSNWEKFQSMVHWLISQFERAVREGKEAEEDFRELDASVLEPQRKEWAALMEKANDERFVNPKAMDVYNAKLVKVVTRVDVQARLMKAEKTDKDGLVGVAAWIASGMTIQDEQLRLQARIREGPKSKRGSSDLDLERKSESIVKLMAAFRKEGVELW